MGEWFNIYLDDYSKELLKECIKFRIDSLSIIASSGRENNRELVAIYKNEKERLLDIYLKIKNIKDQGQYKETKEI
jgi:hypothetical protein